MTEAIVGSKWGRSFVSSIMMTVSEMVRRETPAKSAAAPRNANAPGSMALWSSPLRYTRDSQRGHESEKLGHVHSKKFAGSTRPLSAPAPLCPCALVPLALDLNSGVLWQV